MLEGAKSIGAGAATIALAGAAIGKRLKFSYPCRRQKSIISKAIIRIRHFRICSNRSNCIVCPNDGLFNFICFLINMSRRSQLEKRKQTQMTIHSIVIQKLLSTNAHLKRKKREIVHLLLKKWKNTFVTVTDARGNKKTGASAGCLGFKGRSRRSRYAAQATAEHVGRSIWKGSFFHKFTGIFSCLWMKFLLLYMGSRFFQIFLYFILMIGFNVIFMEISFCCDGSSEDSTITTEAAPQEAPSPSAANWILLDQLLNLPNQNPAWAALVRRCISEARPEDVNSMVIYFLHFEEKEAASRVIQSLISQIYKSTHADLSSDILRASAREMIMRHQITDLNSFNQIIENLQREGESSLYFRETVEQSDILAEGRRTQLREAADAARREILQGSIALEKEAIERRLEALIEQNHTLFREMVRAAEMRKPPTR